MPQSVYQHDLYRQGASKSLSMLLEESGRYFPNHLAIVQYILIRMISRALCFLCLCTLFALTIQLGVKNKNCHSFPEKPTDSSYFVKFNNGNGGVEFGGYIIYQIGKLQSFLRLHLESVNTNGSIKSDGGLTLILRMDCAVVEIDLTIEEKDSDYSGRSTEVRVFFGPTQLIATKNKFVEFSRQIMSLEPKYSCSWVSTIGEPGNYYSKAYLHVDKFGFLLGSKNVSNIRKERDENHFGFKC